MKAGDIFTERKVEREKELKKLSTSGVTRKNIAALEKRNGGKKRKTRKVKRNRRKH